MSRLALIVLFLGWRTAWAQERSLEERIEELERAHRILERNLELEREKAAEAKKKAAVVEAAPGRGLTVSTQDRRYSLTLRARAQIRDSVYIDESNNVLNEINVKTLRLVLSG